MSPNIYKYSFSTRLRKIKYRKNSEEREKMKFIKDLKTKTQEMMKASQKGQLTVGNIPLVVQALAFAGILIAVMLLVLTQLQASFTVGSTAYNATNEVIEGIANIPTYFGLIGTVVALGVVVGIVFLAFSVFNRGQGSR